MKGQSMFRPAKSSDVAQIVDVEVGAFRLDPTGERAERFRRTIPERLAEWLVFESEGRIVAAVHVARDVLRVGRARLLKGDVGEVAVRPDQQGRGTGTALMTGLGEWMPTAGYDLARLGGLARFYSRFGYLRFPRRYVEVRVGGVGKAGASQVSEGEIPLSAEESAAIQPFDPVRDAQPVAELAERFCAAYTGSPDPRWLVATAGPLAMVYIRAGRLTAIVSGIEYERDLTEFEARLTFGLAVFDPDDPAGLAALMKHFVNHACRRGINRLTFRLPFDPRLVAVLSGLPLRFQLIETYGGLAANMMRVVNLESLLSKMREEFESRLTHTAAGTWRGTVAIDIGKARSALTLDGGRVTVGSPAPAAVSVTFPETDLIKLVLGLSSFDSLPDSFARFAPEAGPAAHDVLRALFPARVAFSGMWG